MSEMIECKTCGIKWNIELAAECPSCANRNPSAPVNQSKSITYYDLPDPAVEKAAPRSDNSDQLNAIYSNKAPDVSSSMSSAVNSEVTLNDLADLLQASISASNRTNHAIRALVRFFMVQLVFLTLASLLFFVSVLADSNIVFIFLAFAAVVIGVVQSSRIAWAELEHSNIRGVHSGQFYKF